MYSL
jgi:hypothetical protein